MVGVAAGIVVGCDGALWSAMGCCGSGGVLWVRWGIMVHCWVV